MTTRPCKTPGCNSLTQRTRCIRCEATHQQGRNKTRHHYKGTYKARAKQVRLTATRCWLCNQPFQPGDRIQADHVTPADPNSELKAAHGACNEARGNKPPPTHPQPHNT